MRTSERQQHEKALLDAFIVATAAEEEDQINQLLHNSPDSSSSSDDSSSSGYSSFSSDTENSPFPVNFDILDPLPGHIISALEKLHQQRYMYRRSIPKTPENLSLLLNDYKLGFPDLFRSYTGVSPACFDALITILQDHPIFQNNSPCGQMPVEQQVAIALYRFRHYGNAASAMKVALWAGVSYGSVRNATVRVLQACCDSRFRNATMPWPTPEQKEQAKAWVEERSCPAWRDGWLMVDGTLVPVFQRPHHFGNAYFDRKSNYSLNVQLVSLPNLSIVDYSVGLPGSQHDATAWQNTKIYKEHDRLLEQDEFIWVDSAYPLRHWCQAPYKAPENLHHVNKDYNYHVSAIRIRSEHCVGFLKGRWSSLRGLRLRIDDQRTRDVTTMWIIACMHLHNFAIMHESGNLIECDTFFMRGQEILQEERELRQQWEREQIERLEGRERGHDHNEQIALLEGKLRREHLKEALF